MELRLITELLEAVFNCVDETSRRVELVTLRHLDQERLNVRLECIFEGSDTVFYNSASTFNYLVCENELSKSVVQEGP